MNFAQELRRLNKQQRQAVEAIEGPVMVVAGPGTGKTQILTLRIANILQKTDTSPESILALTFTESAVTSMKRRLLEIIGPTAYRVSIKTIHGFCNEIIQEYPQAFPMIAGEHNISEVDQINIIRSLLESNRQRFSRDIVSSISELKREGLSPADVRENKELSELYAAYQQQLQKMGRYDYDDMVLSVAQVLKKNRNLRLTLQEKYLYILVDEHQDTNQSQNSVIELLAGDDSPNLFIVGDAKQAIYRFQGAQLENFTYFKKRFKRATVIALTENYRSTQTILDAALDVALGQGALIARAPHAKKQISIAACATVESEAYAIARHIQERIKRGAKPQDIAALYRVHKDSALIARYLEKLGVPVSLLAGDDAFSHVQVRKLIAFLEAVRDFGTDYGLVPVLYLEDSRIAPLDVAILIETARKERRTIFSLIRDKKILEKITPESAEATFALYQKLSLWRAMSKSFNLLPMFEEMVRQTALIEGGIILFPLLQEAIAGNRDTTLDDFLNQLRIMREHRVNLTVASRDHAGVQLMTAHKAKGLEFEYVYILGAMSSGWEERRNRNVFRFFKKGKDEEAERNLFYVAVTRAKKELVISYARTKDGKEQLQSMFVATMRSELTQQLSLELFEKEFEPREIEFLQPPQKSSAREKDFWRKRFLERGLSVSALNNYLQCPMRFFYVNLVGIPEAQHPSAQIGEAAHGALKYAVESISSELITKKQFLDRFAFLLSRMPMREIDYCSGLKKGQRVLSQYWDQNHKTWQKSSKPEFAVNEVELGNIKLRGRIDRIDFYPDGTAHVVDYKFKKPVKDENYYRQLTFYKLLLERGTQWKMKDGSIDFLESGPNGKFRRDVFAPSAKEVRELELEIKRVSEEILKLEFFDKGCKDKECKYCAFETLFI